MISTDKTQLNINVLTQEQYEQAKADEELDADGLYMVPEKLSDYTGGGGGAGKEDVSNKVTSISSSSTDTQYPSAKCVYDIVGDIETLLGGLL